MRAAPPGSVAGSSRLLHFVAMDTVVTIEATLSAGDDDLPSRIERAARWFPEVEAICSRFNPQSELSRLCDHVGEPVLVSPLLFQAIQFAHALAVETGGAFDPTVGDELVRSGFNANYRNGASVVPRSSESSTYRDLVLDPERFTVTLLRPLTLDLGAVAKGLAIDLAARELEGAAGYIIDAGGDIFARGVNADGEPWTVGIRHPFEPGALLETVRLNGQSLCTSANDERAGHIRNPHSGAAVEGVLSVSVIAPTAMAADAFATASYVLGPIAGINFLHRQGVQGVVVASNLERYETAGLQEFIV